jgi:hypothetical protein
MIGTETTNSNRAEPRQRTDPRENQPDQRDQIEDARSSKPPTKHFGIWQVSYGCTLFIFLLLVAVGLLEGIFALARVGEQEFLQPDLKLGCIHIPSKVVTWRVEGYSHDVLSSHGLRDIEHRIQKPAGVTRIAVLGDSTTEGMQVPLSDTYCRVLEQSLNNDVQNASMQNSGSHNRFEVINFACSSYATGQEVLQYEEQVRPYNPDIVVVLFNIGDHAENVFVPAPASTIVPRPYFKVNEDGQLEEDDSILTMNAEKLHPSALMTFLRKNSRIFGVFSQENLALAINEPLYQKINQLFAHLQMSRSVLARNRFIRPSYPLADPMLVSKKLLQRLRKDVESDQAQFVVMLFPNSVQDINYAKIEAELIADSKQQRYNLIDLTEPFSHSANIRRLYLQYHFSSHGHALVADVLRKYLENTLQAMKI